MSDTLIAWMALVTVLALMSLGRASYGFSVYMLAFFMHPAFWWWGKSILGGYPWSYYAGLVFLVAVAVQNLRGAGGPRVDKDYSGGRVNKFAIAMLANATLVHLLLAPSMSVSWEPYSLMAKFVLLYFMMVNSLREPRDLRIMLWSIVLGAAYLGFAVTLDGHGRFQDGRLENAGVPGARAANSLASLLVTVLPVMGGLFLVGNAWEKLLVALTAPLVLNVVILCNSRAAFLALGGAVIAFLSAAGGVARKKALKALALAAVAGFLLLGDEQIVERFMTTFASAEERDNSAASRLIYWKAGFRMIRDHPFGAGGFGFKVTYAGKYLPQVGIDKDRRSVHSGIINDACEWGLQGLALRLLFLGSAAWLMRKAARTRRQAGDANGAAFCACLIASMAAFLGTCFFGDYLDAEWGFWTAALMVGYARIYSSGSVKETVAPVSVQKTEPAAIPAPA